MLFTKAILNNGIKLSNCKPINKNFSWIINNKLNNTNKINHFSSEIENLNNHLVYNNRKFNFSTKFNNKDDILPDHLFYDIPKYTKNPENVDFPWLIGGAPFLELKARFIPEQIFVRSDVPKGHLLKHLFKVFRGVLLASTENDYEFLSEYCEANFLNVLKDKLEFFKKMGYQLELVEDMYAENNARLNPEMHLYDCIVIKGLSIDRKKNMSETNYSVCNDIEDMGFISYIPNYLSDPMNFKNKEMAEEKLKLEFKNINFRAYCMFKTGYKIFIYDKNGKKIFDYDNGYNFNHVCIFETQMIEPPQFKSFSKMETYTEWISKHSFGIWKMIDLDNYMKGNPYFTDPSGK